MEAENHILRLLEDVGEAAGDMQTADIVTMERKKSLLRNIELIDVEEFRATLYKIKGELSGYLNNGELIYGVYRELVETFVLGVNNWFSSEVKITSHKLMKGYLYLYGFDEVFDWLPLQLIYSSSHTDHNPGSGE